MRILERALVCVLFGLSATSFAQAPSTAEPFPLRPVRLIIPYPPGAVANGVGRMVTEKLSATWGQPVVVDNRPGGNGIIGTNAIAKSKPDGYSVGLILASQAITPLLFKALPYDTERDLVQVSLVAEYPFLLLVNNAFPGRTVGDFIRIAKSMPNKVTFASSGVGSGPHLAIELLNMSAGIKLAHVPYKGGGPALADVAGGHVDAFYSSLLSAQPLISAGKIRAIGVTSPKRFEALPDVPAFAEILSGFSATGWVGLIAPTGTPLHVVNSISEHVAHYVRQPDMRSRLLANGLEPRGTTPSEFAHFFRSETQKYRKVISANNITADH